MEDIIKESMWMIKKKDSVLSLGLEEKNNTREHGRMINLTELV
jgi:hypothetical protein